MAFSGRVAELIAIRNINRGTTIASRARRADTFWARGKGLMLERSLPDGGGLVIDPCSSIHMFGMRFALDVLYVDHHDRVVRVQEGIQPWRIGPLRTKHARYVIELPVGAIQASGTAVGDHLLLESCPHPPA
jgi:uncharacterized membrane protein (UPF0127 family)